VTPAPGRAGDGTTVEKLPPAPWHPAVAGRQRPITRREFVRRTAIGACGTAVLGARPLLAAIQAPAAVALRMEAGRVAAEWDIEGGGLRLARLIDAGTGLPLFNRPHGAFRLTLADGTVLDAARMRLLGDPRHEELRAAPGAARASERLPGRRVGVDLRDEDGRLLATWSCVARDGSRYLRQELTLRALREEVPIREVCLLDLPVPDAVVAGAVDGSPAVAGEWYFAVEHPLSRTAAADGRVRSVLPRALPLRAGGALTCSAVVGRADDGQRRRGFLDYVERERAHPYRTFLQYNSWYDLGYFTRFDEAAALRAIEAFGRELHERRGVVLDSFLFDDGWDDRRLWGFHEGFPNGFAPLRDAAARYGAAPGVWLSPWGGYGEPREERLKFGAAHGIEINEHGFALSGPTYFRRFREVCLEMIRAHGVNQFKFDGAGSAARVTPGSEFGSDFEAAIRLIDDLRAEKPDLYVNLTTGTEPSPFWLRHADSIWRGGEDHDFAGEGTERQRWITYRDSRVYRGVVQRGPLFPLNSIMMHGLILATHARGLDADPSGDFPSEIRSFFGSGTQLQEMYITPSLPRRYDWDVLAECARWSRASAAMLVDTHWIGGDPERLEAYGWASWSPAKGILALRNPSRRVQTAEVDLAVAFELPAGAAGRFEVRSPWKADAGLPPFPMEAGRTHRFPLQPFEVRVLEARPV
jgi:hypothetical protein